MWKISRLGTAACVAALIAVSGCSKSKPHPDQTAASTEDWVDHSDTSPEQRSYLEYGRGLVEAVSTQNYAAFYNQLSSHAKATMSLNQFAPADDQAVFARQEKAAEKNVTQPRFLELMQRCEARFGRPSSPLNLHVHTTEAAALSGTKRSGTDGIDTLFAIGNMPELAPAAIRKASLRAKIRVTLSPAQLEETAKSLRVTAEELRNDKDFEPYLTLKLVLVAVEGGLRVGYFEFLPPSMLD
ncbi:MAG: hypothetical protein ABIZ04_27330 [Opitutus sp.]